MMIRNKNTHRLLALLILAPILASSGCTALKEIAALRDVRFNIDRLADVRLAGIDISQIRSYSDLGPLDVLNLTRAIAQKELPLSFQLHVMAENPQENSVSARLLKLDWILLLEDKETISGVYDGDVVLPPGQPQDIPFGISLDLIQFFEGGAKDLVELAMAISGQGGAPKEVKLRATPTVNTPLGPMQYPQPITILSREVGGD